MPQTKANKGLGQVREFFTNLKSQFASAATVSEGSIKTLFEEVRGKLEKALDSLPKESEGDGTCNVRWTTWWGAWPAPAAC